MVKGVGRPGRMKINTKINLLVVIIVAATIMLTLVLQTFKSQELAYYNLVEQVKTMDTHILKALIEEKKIGLTISTGEPVFISLDRAESSLEKIDPDLLGKESSYVSEISHLIELFRSSIQKIIKNNSLLAAGVIFSRSITKPLSLLVQATKSLGHGSFGSSTPSKATASLKQMSNPSREDEISVLTNNFISMENEIQDKIGQLKLSENNLGQIILCYYLSPHPPCRFQFPLIMPLYP